MINDAVYSQVSCYISLLWRVHISAGVHEPSFTPMSRESGVFPEALKLLGPSLLLKENRRVEKTFPRLEVPFMNTEMRKVVERCT